PSLTRPCASCYTLTQNHFPRPDRQSTMPDELYADSISAITITGSVVRIDFVSMGPAADDPNQQPKAVFRQRVVMPVEGFVQSFGTMARGMQQVEQKGLVRP